LATVILNRDCILLADSISKCDLSIAVVLFGCIGARVAVPPPPHLRMMHAAMPPAQPGQLVVYGDHQASVPRPPASAAQLVIYGDQPPPVPRPTAGPLPLATGNVHTHAFNFPPPRQFPRWFLFLSII